MPELREDLECPECGAAFGRGSDVANHRKFRHGVERPRLTSAEKGRRYKALHPDRVRDNGRRFRQSEKGRLSEERNRPAQRRASLRWKEEHPERVREYQDSENARNRQRRAARTRALRKALTDIIAAWDTFDDPAEVDVLIDKARPLAAPPSEKGPVGP